ncbi:IS110 family transposase [Pseudorhodoplanes sinuspersici]|uniref:IS110 family transposase n=1 Tax=Pseudorhodoplanes sinuspersici TaxID=1235591 RepID=A0A1W6ZP83_9HYPH|nr:IS110 family transposase [Pseudorhodoplanes sinuspersici]ARP99181.1 IS110 family transposase [Pseudorhodoplanes sinuspersici]RKE69159.1 transposase [Pseudorhodoplanes sinuspersici]
MIITRGFIGIDVSKHHLDVFEGGFGRGERIANRPEALAPLVARWKNGGVFVLFEATGHYDVRLRQALTAAGIAFARINPARARDFARAAGFLAKTDRIDARMLAAMAQSLAPAPAKAIDSDRQGLALAHKRRDQLVHIRQQERTRRTECHDAILLADIEAHLQWLDVRIAQWDEQIRCLLAQCERLHPIAKLLRSIPGIGPVAATTLIALMPELDVLPSKQVTAIAGLAPFNVDSGQLRGLRRIKGGRKRVRDALYMAAVAAARSHDRFRTVYRRLRAAGKPAKVALIAVARKLLVTANAVLRDKTAFQT